MKLSYTLEVTRQEVDLIKGFLQTHSSLVEDEFLLEEGSLSAMINKAFNNVLKVKTNTVSPLAVILYKMKFKNELKFKMEIEVKPELIGLLGQLTCEIHKVINPGLKGYSTMLKSFSENAELMMEGIEDIINKIKEGTREDKSASKVEVKIN